MTGTHRCGAVIPPAPPRQADLSVAERIAAVVLASPLVVGLHGGRFGEAATYLPGRQVRGVRVTPTEVFIHLVALYPTPVAAVDQAVRAAVHQHLAGLPLTVTVEDYAHYTAAPLEPAATTITTAVPGPVASEATATPSTLTREI